MSTGVGSRRLHRFVGGLQWLLTGAVVVVTVTAAVDVGVAVGYLLAATAIVGFAGGYAWVAVRPGADPAAAHRRRLSYLATLFVTGLFLVTLVVFFVEPLVMGGLLLGVPAVAVYVLEYDWLEEDETGPGTAAGAVSVVGAETGGEDGSEDGSEADLDR